MRACVRVCGCAHVQLWVCLYARARVCVCVCVASRKFCYAHNLDLFVLFFAFCLKTFHISDIRRKKIVILWILSEARS